MKQSKSFLALLLTLLMVLTMGITAFAAESYTITISNEATGHTYEAYQIFAGDLAEKDGKKVLSNIVWGDGITEEGKTTLGNAAEKAKDITSSDDAAAFAKEVAPYLTNPTESSARTGEYTISGLSAGYYLVKDKDNTLASADDFYTAYIMEVVGNVTAEPKGDKPSLKKEIKHNESSQWGVVGDNQIGDTVEFRTVTTVPDTTGYTTYDYIIHDTMSVGLTSNVNTVGDVKILVNDEGEALDADYYTVAASGNSFDLEIDVLKAIEDGKMAKGNKLYTYYTGVLNADAKVYDEGKQDNEAYLEYSNNPNDTTGKGQTEKSKVYDWTFKMEINKVDKNGNELTGAKFVLSKDSTLKVKDMQCDENGNPTATANLIGLVKVSDGIYRIATDKDAAESIVYAMDAGSSVIKGLDDSTDYYLYETKAPAGYNLLDKPVQFKISADYSEDGSALKADNPTVKVGEAEASATLKTNVVNNEGSVLPGTGGIGTTVFYIVGSALLVGAAIVLITKKRMKKNEN